MEQEPDAPDQKEPPEPPPFDPDPDLITYLERGGKPSEREMRKMAEQA